MKRILLLLTILFVFQSLSIAQSPPPKREFRAAWLSTVANIDWPSSPGISVSAMKKQLLEILDYLKDANLNAVVYQIRPACDAMYYSEIEPWSYWLTGQQGKAPSPFFDPLEFAVEEAHKRGMELHAWFNPYRVRLSGWNLQLDPQNVAVQHPDWVLNIGGDEILDPGLPQVREHVLNVIMDVVRRYDIDGVHFDDYFYLSGITNQDDETFDEYNRGFTDKGDWRRDNVNELLRMIYAAIQAEAPHVKFGQSPRGIWKSGIPSGTSGGSAYSEIYCDAVAWLDEQIIDYLTPQLYWPFGGGQDYGKLMPWWVEQRNGRQIIPGLPFYRVGELLDRTQLGKMITLNRNTDGCYGEVFFTANDFKDNNLNNTDTLKNNYYKYKSIIPSMEWKDGTAPAEPANLRYDRVAGLGTTALTWDAPADDDVAWYAIYVFDSQNVQQEDLDDATKIFDITSKNYYQITNQFPDQTNYYLVTALDHNHNESVMSNVFEFQPNITLPAQPSLEFPLAGADDIRDTLNLVWNYAQGAGSYHLQVAMNNQFGNKVVDETGIVDTSFQVTGLQGETTYYWKVTAENLAGSSEDSEIFDFTTAFPAAPMLVYPTDVTTDIELAPTFQWTGREDAINYYLQIFEGLTTDRNKSILDSVLTTTEYTSPELKPGTFYSWRVRVSNQFGGSLWSTVYKFKTIVILPGTPVVTAPLSGFDEAGESIDVTWEPVEYAESYNLEIATDQNFQNKFHTKSGINGTSYTVNGLLGETDYFLRVQGKNNGGTGDFSSTVNFSTGFPKLITLLLPNDLSLDVDLEAELIWHSSPVASNYLVQLSRDVVINPAKMVLDTVVVDTSLITPILQLNTVYSWRVNAVNSIGESGWTDIYKFKTVEDTTTSVEDEQMPTEYALYQNYPNPFNPTTNIKFDIPESSFISLIVYNVLGQEVRDLISDNLMPGTYEVMFVSDGLPSGIYFYVLNSGKKKFTKKMLLIK